MPETFYRASDGSEHPTPKDAERRNAIITANEEMREAERRFLVALADTAVTADGVVLKEARRLDLWTIGRRHELVKGVVRAVGDDREPNPVTVATEALNKLDANDWVGLSNRATDILLDALRSLGASSIVDAYQRIGDRE